MSWSNYYSDTKNIAGEITINKKTGREINLLVGQCSICNRKKSMIAKDNTIKAEGLGGFFKNLGKKRLKVSKKMAKNVLSNPGRVLDLTAKIATAATSKIQTSFINITRIDILLQHRKGSLPWQICLIHTI